jgi:hypothetical protein
MADFNVNSLVLIFVTMATALRAEDAVAAHPLPRTIDLVAQSADVDLANNNVVFRKVRIAQGRHVHLGRPRAGFKTDDSS